MEFLAFRIFCFSNMRLNCGEFFCKSSNGLLFKSDGMLTSFEVLDKVISRTLYKKD